jgi:soluble lytic murein transglycosylase-like protein
VSRAILSADLSAGAATAHWAGLPGGLPGRATIVVPDVLMKAIAWQESNWRSTIVACSGTYGTMQVESGTATWMNRRFHTSYAYRSTVGNVQLGSEFLEWLIAYFGRVYLGGSYDLTNPKLLEMVISGYNAGPGNVSVAADGTVEIVNPRYVAGVEALTIRQPWLR